MNSRQTTDPQNELLTEVDDNNKVIGSIPRGIAHNSPKKFYRTIYIIATDNKDRILLQKRSSTKDLYPDCWDLSVGGHVNYGKSYIETAIIELAEELGIKSTAKELKFIGEVLVKLPTSSEYFNVFEYKIKPTDQIKTNTKEVGSVMWMTMDEIKKSMRQHKLNWYARPLQIIEALY